MQSGGCRVEDGTALLVPKASLLFVFPAGSRGRRPVGQVFRSAGVPKCGTRLASERVQYWERHLGLALWAAVGGDATESYSSIN